MPGSETVMIDTDTKEESILNKLRSKARDVHTSVAEKTGDAFEAGAATDSTEESMFNKLKGKAMEVHASVTEKITDASEASMEKIQEAIAELDEVSPFLCELGYTVEGIKIGVGLIPDVSIDIGGMTKTMPVETYVRILEEHKDKKILISIVKTLQTVSALQHKVHFMGMRSDNITITLGLPPKVSMNFRKTGQAVTQINEGITDVSI
jgi:hypothetical protein